MARGARLIQVGDVVAGRYRVDDLLGEGGMAIVWRATHTGTDRPCALKFIQPQLVSQDHTVQLFLKEAKVAGRLGTHPYIVDILDSGLDKERQLPYIAMELLAGQTLERTLREDGPLSIETMCIVLEQLGEAMDHAHAAGVIHRDLKPANIFMTRDHKDRPMLKVMDFGIAKILDAATGGTATQVGTPAYCAPEQLGKGVRQLAAERGTVIAEGVSPQTDVWALGLIAYQMLTGIPPARYWEVDTYADLIVKIALDAAQEPSTVAGELADRLPPRFDQWFERCTRRNAAERWESFGEAVRELLPLCHLVLANPSLTVPIADKVQQPYEGVSWPGGRTTATMPAVLPTGAQTLAMTTPVPPPPTPEPVLRSTVEAPPTHVGVAQIQAAPIATIPEAPAIPQVPSSIPPRPMPMTPSVPPDTHVPWQTASAAPSPPRTSLVGVIIGAVVVMLLCVGGGIFFLSRAAPATPVARTDERAETETKRADDAPAPAPVEDDGDDEADDSVDAGEEAAGGSPPTGDEATPAAISPEQPSPAPVQPFVAPPPSPKPVPTGPKPCTKDTDCPGNEICEGGRCRAPKPKPKPAGPKPCTKDTDCPGNQICESLRCVSG